MALKECLELLSRGEDLTESLAQSALHLVMQGELSDAEAGGLLMALRVKGESVDELTGCARAMRELCARVNIDAPLVLDTCGTGGSGAHLFNISTASAFVAAAAGLLVAKHGNRAASGVCGSADVLAAAGLPLDLQPDQVEQCIAEVGIGFLFAQTHHSAMRHVMGVRKALAVPTLFNLIGPLCNPASATHQVLGVSDECWVYPIAQVLQRLGVRAALVLHSSDGTDEISPAAPTQGVGFEGEGDFLEYTLDPADVGIHCELDAIRIDDVAGGLAMFASALRGEVGPALDAVALNAGAALWVGGVCESWIQGVEESREILVSGRAWDKLQHLVKFAAKL